MDSNLFTNLPLATDLASWVTEPTALARVSYGRSSRDIFTWSDTALDRSLWPSLSTDTITDPSIDIEGQYPTWKVVRTRESVSKDHVVGEITGKIGLLRDYCLDPSKRWQELRHPEPFVFFHPQLPIYIDGRHGGSILRYVRRSCRPNVTIKTYITNEVEYHFCFVAKKDISANSEITAMWYLDPQLFKSTDVRVKQDPNDSAQVVAKICISNVLANFGGCACEPQANCLLASLDCRRHTAVLPSNTCDIVTAEKEPMDKEKMLIHPGAIRKYRYRHEQEIVLVIIQSALSEQRIAAIVVRSREVEAQAAMRSSDVYAHGHESGLTWLLSSQEDLHKKRPL